VFVLRSLLFTSDNHVWIDIVVSGWGSRLMLCSLGGEWLRNSEWMSLSWFKSEICVVFLKGFRSDGE